MSTFTVLIFQNVSTRLTCSGQNLRTTRKHRQFTGRYRLCFLEKGFGVIGVRRSMRRAWTMSEHDSKEKVSNDAHDSQRFFDIDV